MQASLEDLTDAMRKAQPIAPSMSKEEWLEKRRTHKRGADANAGRKVHGTSGSGAADEGKGAAVMLAPKSLAKVPKTVPELPNAYLVRQEDLNQLKGALLRKEGTGSTSLTSKEAQKKLNKVGAHGMVSLPCALVVSCSSAISFTIARLHRAESARRRSPRRW